MQPLSLSFNLGSRRIGIRDGLGGDAQHHVSVAEPKASGLEFSGAKLHLLFRAVFLFRGAEYRSSHLGSYPAYRSLRLEGLRFRGGLRHEQSVRFKEASGILLSLRAESRHDSSGRLACPCRSFRALPDPSHSLRSGHPGGVAMKLTTLFEAFKKQPGIRAMYGIPTCKN